jgi:hypothetical protein
LYGVDSSGVPGIWLVPIRSSVAVFYLFVFMDFLALLSWLLDPALVPATITLVSIVCDTPSIL